jgi:multidrug resistance efflux pump
MGKAWTIDGTVRANVVTLAPDVAGQVVQLPVRDNQFMHKGDLLMKIDPGDCQVAVDLSKAAVDQADADYANKEVQAARRVALSDLSTLREERQTFGSAAAMAAATLEEQKANLERANINLERTEVHSPVNGWVTNLLLRQGTTPRRVRQLSRSWMRIRSGSTVISRKHSSSPFTTAIRQKIWLLGDREVLNGHVNSVARGIMVSDVIPGKSGLASVSDLHLSAVGPAHTRTH